MKVPINTYYQYIAACAEAYQRTYGTRSVKEMVERKVEYDKLVVKTARVCDKPLEEVKKDASDKWTEKYYK